METTIQVYYKYGHAFHWQSFCINLVKELEMMLLEMTNQFADRIYEGSFLLGLAISALFYLKYKKYTLQMHNEDMIDKFLK